MNFVQYSVKWARGEVFEGILIAIFGVLLVFMAFLFWKLGNTQNAKAMFVPLLIVGLIFTSAGLSGYFSNQQRMKQFRQSYQQAPVAFVKAEKKQVEGFKHLYTFTLILAPVCFLLATIFFWASENPHLRAVAIALVLIGLGGLVIDSFAKERADIYYAKIQTEFSSIQEQ